MNQESFDGYTFPAYKMDADYPTAPAISGAIELSRGAFDAHGSGRAPQKNYTIGIEFTIAEDSRALVQTAVDAARAKVGVVGRLYLRTAGNDLRWITARCLRVTTDRKEKYRMHQPVKMDFEILNPGWNGTARTGGSFWDAVYVTHAPLIPPPAAGGVAIGAVSAASGAVIWQSATAAVIAVQGGTFQVNEQINVQPPNAYSMTGTTISAQGAYAVLANSGNRPVDNAILSVIAGGGAVSNVAIQSMYPASPVYSMAFSGTINATKHLVIDCGAHSVKNDGAAALANFSLGTGHQANDWLVLQPGTTVLRCTATGTPSELRAAYSDGWQ